MSERTLPCSRKIKARMSSAVHATRTDPGNFAGSVCDNTGDLYGDGVDDEEDAGEAADEAATAGDAAGAATRLRAPAEVAAAAAEVA